MSMAAARPRACGRRGAQCNLLSKYTRREVWCQARLQEVQNPTVTACAAAPRSLQTLARAGSLRAASGRFLKNPRSKKFFLTVTRHRRSAFSAAWAAERRARPPSRAASCRRSGEWRAGVLRAIGDARRPDAHTLRRAPAGGVARQARAELRCDLCAFACRRGTRARRALQGGREVRGGPLWARGWEWGLGATPSAEGAAWCLWWGAAAAAAAAV